MELGQEILVLRGVDFALVEALAIVVACFFAVLIGFLVLVDLDLVILRADPAST